VTGVHVIDVTDPSAPFELGGFHRGGYSRGLALADGLVYLALDFNGLEIIDFGPEYPRIANAPPNADAGPDQSVECSSPAGASVTLDGSLSTDPDGDALDFSWANGFGSAEGATPTVERPLGVSEVRLVVSDRNGGTDADSVEIHIVDSTRPDVEASLERLRGRGGDRDREGDDAERSHAGPTRYVVRFSCHDACDPAPLAIATLDGAPVQNGSVYRRRRGSHRGDDDDRARGRPVPPVLSVICSDASGNTGSVDATPAVGGRRHDRADEDDEDDDRERGSRGRHAASGTHPR
jgi:hypothetical protein